jgi:hypothetical protein
MFGQAVGESVVIVFVYLRMRSAMLTSVIIGIISVNMFCIYCSCLSSIATTKWVDK